MKRYLSITKKLAWLALAVAVAAHALLTPSAAHAESSRYKEEPIQFQSGETKLSGTVLMPNTPGPHPAVVLVHGSNSSDREKYRSEAEMFAAAGIAALIYDKRADGFSQSRAGGRSYSILAEDVNAAASALSARSDINRKAVGLWGISEGAWVASLAATREASPAAFLITVGAVGVLPIEQQSWQLANRMQDQGVSSPGMARAFSEKSLQLALSGGMFAEALYDPMPTFEQVKQPVLAIWGSRDRVEPALDSSKRIQQALQRGGNDKVTLRFFANAGHLLKETADGIKQLDTYPAGYAESMTSWIQQTAGGNAPESAVVGEWPKQERHAPSGIGKLHWHNSVWLQAAIALVLLFGFAGVGIRTAFRTLRKNAGTAASEPGRRSKIVLCAAASLTVLGFLLYFGFLLTSGAKQLAPVWLGRSLVWLVLQGLAYTALAAALVHAKSLWAARFAMAAAAVRVRSGALLAASVLFITWAAYWQLFFR
ncbi:S9 family peptidase [Paenibacillus sp. 32352]|uniref:alpha/beta hydrolase family protein n=1 Tax=Paenibacillus sp. 32352 TaxID=1969111 RepID=UPI0015C4C6FF|nr:alpha/beta hydrolase [Paenibacillus sp. 32352]